MCYPVTCFLALTKAFIQQYSDSLPLPLNQGESRINHSGRWDQIGCDIGIPVVCCNPVRATYSGYVQMLAISSELLE